MLAVRASGEEEGQKNDLAFITAHQHLLAVIQMDGEFARGAWHAWGIRAKRQTGGDKKSEQRFRHLFIIEA